MSQQPVFGTPTYGPMSDDIVVDRLIGNAYYIVRMVAERMHLVRTVADNVLDVSVLATNISDVRSVSNRIVEIKQLHDQLSKLVVLHSDLPQLVQIYQNLDYLLTIPNLVAGVINTLPYSGPVPPLNPVPDKEWISTFSGRRYMWVTDSDGGQWVETSPVAYQDDPVSVLATIEQVSLATTQANIATNKAENALASEQNALASKLAIDNRIYPGALSGNPATRPNGLVIQLGDQYYNSILSSMMVYRSNGWINYEASALASSVLATQGSNTAMAQAAIALAAKVVAETARDAAQLTAGVYASTAAGIAATTTGKYFSVPSADSKEFLILYLNNAGAAVEQKRYPSAASVDSLISAMPFKAPLVATGNIFNKVTITPGSFISAVNGTITANASYDLSALIAVAPGLPYVSASRIRFSCYFAANGTTVVEGGATADIYTFTPPAGAAFIRITTYAADTAGYKLEQGSVATAYDVFGKFLDVSVVRDGSLTVAKLPDLSITPKKVAFLPLGKNLFNKATVTSSFFMGPTGALSANGSFDVSDFISVVPGTAYVTSLPMRFTCFFNVAGGVVAGGTSTDGSTTFTPPAGAVFIRISVLKANVAALQVEAGAVTTGFEAHAYQLKSPDGVPIMALSVTAGAGWKGKTWATMTDSLGNTGWQPAVVASLGLIWTNYAQGGTRISGDAASATAMCQDTRINAIPATTDLVTVMGGTNDWINNVPLGAADSADPLTFYGALNVMLGKLSVRFPAKRVAVFSTCYAEAGDYVSRGFPNAASNAIGLTTRDYAEAIRVACKRWGTPCIDTAQNNGWNSANMAFYFTGPDFLHPIAAGAARISSVAAGALRSVEALS